MNEVSLEPIPLCAPHLSGNEARYLQECVETGWVSSVGRYVNLLEERVAQLVNRRAGVATTSGTAALHLALLLAHVQPGEEVLVPDLTFVAPANCVRYAGAEPVLVDCDPETMQIDVELVRNFLNQRCERRKEGCFNCDTGRRIAAVMPVHLLGHPVDIDPLLEVCNQWELPLIEDATESLGAFYRGRPVGSHGLISCYSFNGNKIVTAGGGGLLVTDQQELADKARYLSTQAKDDPLYYVHNEVGYNYRLTNIQAALAVAQLEQLSEFVAAKRRIASVYQQAFQDLEGCLKLPREQPWATSSFWLYTVTLQGAAAGQRDGLLAFLNENGVQARPLWNAIHQNRPFEKCQLVCRERSQASELVARSVSLPSSVGLTSLQQAQVCQLVKRFVCQIEG